MTPTEALAQALRSLGDAYPVFRQRPTQNDLGGETWWAHGPLADSLLAALDALGFTVARTQDARDGEALRLLRDALPGCWPVLSCRGRPFVMYGDSSRMVAKASGPTIAAAADACREAIEATR